MKRKLSMLLYGILMAPAFADTAAGTKYAIDWNNQEFVECSVSTTKLLGAIVAQNKDPSKVALYSQTLSLIRKIKESNGALSQQQFDAIFSNVNAQIPPGDFVLPSRGPDFFKGCINKVDQFAAESKK